MVGTSEEAVVDVWKFMQIFLKDLRFQKYANGSLGIFRRSLWFVCFRSFAVEFPVIG
jgi:hypothetical protein